MSETTAAPASPLMTRPSCLKRGPGWVLFIVALIGTFSASYPNGCMGVLMPTIAKELNIGTDLIVLVNIAYSLICGVLTLPFGRLGDRIGYQKMFIAGQIVLLVSDLLCTFLSTNFVLLIVFRSFVGVGSAMVLSVVQAMLAQAFPGMRGRMMGLYSLSVSYSGAFSGLISSGIFAAFDTWRASLLFSAVFNVIAIVLGIVFLGEFLNKPTKGDRVGTVLLMLTLSSLLIALNARTVSIPVPIMIGLGVVFLVSLYFFIKVENKAEAPLLDFRLLKNKSFTLGFLGCLIGYAVSSGVNGALPFYIQNVKGQTPTINSLCTIGFSLGLGTFGPFTGGWCDKKGPYKFLVAAMLVQCVAIFGYLILGISTPLWVLIAAVIIYGIGGGLYYAPCTSMVMGSVPSNSGGVASGMMSTARNLGGGIGATIFSLCVNLTKDTSKPFDNYVAGQTIDCGIMFGLTIVATILMIVLYMRCGRNAKGDIQRPEAE